MPLKPKQIRWGTGALLVIATLVTRLPFVSHTLFEFDSVDFAVALDRFSLSEVTPHMPGYILHILLARVFYGFTHEANSAFVSLSVALSIGSVLFMWRAAAQLRGERLALMTAVIWLTTPLFWFHGEIAAIYIEEAFFTSAILYLGLRLLNHRDETRTFLLLAAAYALAIGTRQTSALFFLPAIVYLLFKLRLSKARLAGFCLVFVSICALWFCELVRESGGLATYWYFASVEHIYRSQSILFGNPLSVQLQTSGKVIFYELVGLLGLLAVLIPLTLYFRKQVALFVRHASQTTKFAFVALVALTPLTFYFLVYFMKPGYLLNVLPSEILIGAVLLDQAAIWIAERIKRRANNPTELTRPIITRTAIYLAASVALLNIIWMFAPWPGTSFQDVAREASNNELMHGAHLRTASSPSMLRAIGNRACNYTNIYSIRYTDSIDNDVERILKQEGADSDSTVILSTWWYRWGYMKLPNAYIYDIQAGGPDLRDLAVGLSHHMQRVNLYQQDIQLPPHSQVLLMLPHNSIDFAELSSQLQLERVQAPEYLDIYRVPSPSAAAHWRDRVFHF